MGFRLWFTLALSWGICSLSGCKQGSDTPPPEPVLHPVKGKVTANGKPLVHAVLTFLQVDEKGTTSVGETDEEGIYELSFLTKPGTAAAKYKVAISYLVGTDGTVYGLAPRSGLAKPYGMITAKELITPEWSDLGRTTHMATVPVNGGTFDFDIKEPLLPPPTPQVSAQNESPKPTPEPEKTKSDRPDAQEKSPATTTPSLSGVK
jgi:hypothetical protein